MREYDQEVNSNSSHHEQLSAEKDEDSDYFDDEQGKGQIKENTHQDDSDFMMPDNDELLYSDPEVDFEEYEDYVMIGGQKLKKPFVEKPVNAEDHEIKVYYSSLNPCGSGYNVLFRKTNNFSGKFIPQRSGNSTIRKDGSYIYEEFL